MARPTNDATPSWSGYNYQGKITLLIALETLNNYPQTYQDYHIEIERTEDLIVFCIGRAQAFYQVKACLGKDSWSNYRSSHDDRNALKKLKDHRDNHTERHAAAKCYLCSAVAITDWTAKANPYCNDIDLYTYHGHHPTLQGVIDDIKGEVDRYLQNNQITGAKEHVVYGELCEFLDRRVSDMHESPNPDYSITLSDFAECINDSINKHNISFEAELKERIYQFMTREFEEARKDYCTTICQNKRPNCAEDCGAASFYDLVANEVCFEEFSKLVNPDKLKWDDELSFVANMQLDGFCKYVYPLCSQVKDLNKITATKNLPHLDGRISIVPTIMRIDDQLLPQETSRSIQGSLEIIANNAYVHPFYNGHHIALHLGSSVRSILTNQPLMQHGITYCPADKTTVPINGKYQKRDRIQQAGVEEIILIDYDDAVQEVSAW